MNQSKKYVSLNEWALMLEKLYLKLNPDSFDAIVAIKRSGLMVGVYLSHFLRLPLFTDAEIQFLEPKHNRVLLVDTTSWTGRTLRKAKRRIEKNGKTVSEIWVLYQLSNREIGIKDIHSIEYTNVVKEFWWSPAYQEHTQEEVNG